MDPYHQPDSDTIYPDPKRKKLDNFGESNDPNDVFNVPTHFMCASDEIFPFTEKSGPQSSTTNESKPIDYFNLFINTSLLTLMVNETNKHAQELLRSREITQASRLKAWEPVSLLEMKAFIAVLLEMGITKRPTLFSYWVKNSRSIPWFAKMFSRNRFQLLLQCFHLVDNKECFPPGHEQYDPCFKCLPMIEHANRVFKYHYNPHRELFIDESSIGNIGHSNVVTNKHSKFNIKFWMLCDATSKYCLGLYYNKKVRVKTDIGIPHENGLGYDIVVNLLEESQYFNKGHHLFVGDYFSSIALAKHLFCRGTYLTSIVKSSTKDIPDEVKTAAINETKYVRDEVVLLCAYRERISVKKPLILLSTYASRKITQATEKSKAKPYIVNSYNHFMGKAGEIDQMLYTYVDERRTLQFWKKITFNIIARLILNAYILYKEVIGKKAMTRLEFISSIITDIENEWLQERKEDKIDDCKNITLLKLPGRNLRQCVVCSNKKTGIKRSHLICAQCKKGIHPLCLAGHVCTN